MWTHDSVGLGEDGPTHQPVEHYAALRAIPQLWFVRPADAKETAGAWKVALEREDGPVALALSRQKLPTLEETQRDGVERGAYVLWESESANGSPDADRSSRPAPRCISRSRRRSSSTSRACTDASSRCRAGSCSRQQPADYRDEVLPPDVKARVSVEAGVELGWSKWVGDEGDSISIERFGASAPGGTVLEKLGYSVDNVVARVLALRERVS